VLLRRLFSLSKIRLLCRRAFTIFCCLSLICTWPVAAGAQTAPAEIEVRVVDAAGHPVADARVFINGPLSTSALTPSDGIIRFEDVDPGIYGIRVARSGFDGVELPEIEALAGRRKVVTMHLVARSVPVAPNTSVGSPAPDGLKVIAVVKARSSVTIENVDVDEGSPVRRISENLADALNKLGGITILEAPKTGSLTISLRNADPSNTTATASGIPLSGSGGGALQAVAAELATGASADANGGIGSVGGAVNFRTLEPTRTWQTQFSSSYGSYQKASEQLSISGSNKKLGIAVQHAVRTGDSILTGLTFADASGQTYVHDGSTAINADFIKLRYAVNPKLSFSGSILGGETKRSPLCDLDVTILPCGTGPGGLVTTGAVSRAIGAQGQIGNANVTFNLFRQNYSSNDNESGRVSAGVPSPFQSTSTSVTQGFTLYGTVPFGRHTLLANVGSTSGSGQITTLSTGAFSATAPLPFRSAYTVTGDTYKFSDRWSATLAYGLNTDLLQSRSAVDFTVVLTPSRTETIRATTGQYGAGGNTGFLGFFGDPVSAVYDCPANEVLTTVPGDPPEQSTFTNAAVQYTKRGKRGSIQLNGYWQTNRGGVLTAQYPLSAYTGAPLPAGYLNAIEAQWQAPTICGTQPFDPSRVYVSQQLTGQTVRYRGIDTSGQLVLGRAVIAQMTYSINGATLKALDPRLAAVGSDYIAGGQLPGRPLHKGSLLIDAVQPHAHLEYVVNGTWTASNNASGLGPYILVSSGVTWTVPRGRLTLFANNMFNTDTGLFTRSEFLSPNPTIGGGTYLPLVPQLLPPRSYTLLYSVRTGRTR
jgi:hypothetical protein